MIVITDSNIIYSALITPYGSIASILKESKTIQFFAPDYLIEEVNKHLSEIAQNTDKSKKRRRLI